MFIRRKDNPKFYLAVGKTSDTGNTLKIVRLKSEREHKNLKKKMFKLYR